MTFGERLKELRKAKKMTQQQLAQAAGIAVSTVSKLEQRDIEPSFATAAAIALALGVSLDKFTDD
jgi:transcriptional regulator with XRE-family HTH domain